MNRSAFSSLVSKGGKTMKHGKHKMASKKKPVKKMASKKKTMKKKKSSYA